MTVVTVVTVLKVLTGVTVVTVVSVLTVLTVVTVVTEVPVMTVMTATKKRVLVSFYFFFKNVTKLRKLNCDKKVTTQIVNKVENLNSFKTKKLEL